MMKKKIFVIIILVLLCAALGAVYYLLTHEDTGEVDPGTQIELLPGEVLESNSTLLMFEHLERAAISRLDVYNAYGSYAFEYDSATGDFCLEGNPGAPYDQYSFSSLIVDAGYAIASRRVTDHCEDFSVYGLDEASIQGKYTITTHAGMTHTVYIGSQVPGSSMYYCRYEGRDAVYVSNSNYNSTLLASLPTLISPILAYPMNTTDYYAVEDFYLKKNGETVVAVDYLEEDERDSSNYIYRMTEPAAYIVNDTNYSSVLQKLCTPYGMATLEIARDKSGISQEILAKYGLDAEHYVYELHYVYNKMENHMIFSAQNPDGSYYCYSFLFDLVALCKGDTFSFLDWSLIDYTSKVTLNLNINDVASITVDGLGVSETFSLYGTGEELQVLAQNAQLTFDADGVKNFRQFYKTMLVVYMEGYAEKTDTSDLILTVTIVKRDGEELVYQYYGYTTRRCFYTVNGQGEFYVLRDAVEKIASDAQKVLRGEAVDSWAKN